MKKMVASMDFPYDSRDIKAGDEFDAHDKDTEVLKIYGRAELVGEDAPPPKRRYRRRDLRAQE